MGSIAIWSTVPLIMRLLTTMKRRSGLYFYAILITSCGITTRQFGILTLWLIPGCPWILRRLLVEVGTIAMLSGFSIVLVSAALRVILIDADNIPVQSARTHIDQPSSETGCAHHDHLQRFCVAYRVHREQCWHSIFEESRHEETYAIVIQLFW